MGRSIVADPLSHVVSVRFTASQLLALKELAAAAGLTPADYLRGPIVRATGARARAAGEGRAATPVAGVARAANAGRSGSRGKPAPMPPPSLIAPDRFLELRRQGINLNQIAHQLNAMQLVSPAAIGALAAEIRELLAPDLAAARALRAAARTGGDNSEAHDGA